MKGSETEELIRRLQQSDRDAFNTVYMEYYALLMNYATLMVTEDSAKDIVHDVFFGLWKNRFNLSVETICDGSELRRYLFRSTYNAAVSLIRRNLSSLNYRQWMHDKLEATYQYYDIDKSDVMQKFYTRDVRQKIDAAVAKLPPKCKEVFLLNYSEGLSASEISARLGLSVSTIHNHIHNAMLRLRNAISEAEDKL